MSGGWGLIAFSMAGIEKEERDLFQIAGYDLPSPFDR
jgi:hypothetical protein